MESISFAKFKSCLDTWAKQNEKGEQCLSRQVLGKPSSELQDVSDGLKQVLDTMFEEYATIVDQLGLAENLQNNDDANIPKEIVLLRNCVDMYDQEYMVKECIRGIVSGDGFATQQHLAGSIALWKSESYLDEQVQEEIKKL
ncbi:unnamed protein product [Mucor circinelloides]|uniref:Uncharacterized protein n=1 Tax=Mucor circinelloides f. circinelloides (strain 1006PhL) TaxID=1220926 RepID=S2IZ12_MUCC1|nr:hypothetical protein HMPREF1544_10209 [Mucor circinelloides 1006PhL]KAG1085602.1 hypothetical protein G6F42_021332 [Rhizopus arrhizus]